MIAYPIDRIRTSVYPIETLQLDALLLTQQADTLITPGGIPARSHSSAMIMVAPGSLSEGLTISVLPVTVARAADHNTILVHQPGPM